MGAFEAAAEAHCVTLDACRGQEVQEIVQALNSGRKVYGWKLSDLRWFDAGERPCSGIAGVPEFKGQGKGWIWSLNQLPASLEAPAHRSEAHASREAARPRTAKTSFTSPGAEHASEPVVGRQRL